MPRTRSRAQAESNIAPHSKKAKRTEPVNPDGEANAAPRSKKAKKAEPLMSHKDNDDAELVHLDPCFLLAPVDSPPATEVVQYPCQYCGIGFDSSALADLLEHEERFCTRSPFRSTLSQKASDATDRDKPTLPITSLSDDSLLHILGSDKRHALQLDGDDKESRWMRMFLISCKRCALIKVPLKLTRTHTRQLDAFQLQSCRYQIADLTLTGHAFSTEALNTIISYPATRLHSLALMQARKITSISCLSQCEMLRVLTITDSSKIVDLSPLKSCGRLARLTVDSCIWLRSLANLPRSLVHLGLNNAIRLEHLSPLETLPDLHTLSLKHCYNVTSLEPLIKCPSLRILDLTGCDKFFGYDIRYLAETPGRARNHQQDSEDQLQALAASLQKCKTLRKVITPTGRHCSILAL